MGVADMNKRELDQAFENELRALGASVVTLDTEGTSRARGSVVLYDLRFKLDADEGTSVLAVLKGVRDGQALVGFVGAPDLKTCVLATAKKLRADAVRWREDRPWGE